MITRKQYLEAKNITEEYCRQQYIKEMNRKVSVTLSAYGKEMQTPHNKKGVIVDKMLAGMTDYTVEVLWEDGKKEWMHESQTQVIQ